MTVAASGYLHTPLAKNGYKYTIISIDEIYALTLISELGTDFTKWPTGKHFATWVGLCPNFKKSSGKMKSSKTRRGKGGAAYTFRLVPRRSWVMSGRRSKRRRMSRRSKCPPRRPRQSSGACNP